MGPDLLRVCLYGRPRVRPVLHGDVSSMARALYAVHPAERLPLCERLITRAERADRYREATGRAHPGWGNGSLMAVARTRTLPKEPSFDDDEYCQCFALVLAILLKHRAKKPA